MTNLIEIFQVEVSHPSAPWNGQHEFRVTTNPDGTCYAKSPEFGCGRDADHPQQAIARLVAANGGAVENLCAIH